MISAIKAKLSGAIDKPEKTALAAIASRVDFRRVGESTELVIGTIKAKSSLSTASGTTVTLQLTELEAIPPHLVDVARQLLDGARESRTGEALLPFERGEVSAG